MVIESPQIFEHEQQLSNRKQEEHKISDDQYHMDEVI